MHNMRWQRIYSHIHIMHIVYIYIYAYIYIHVYIMHIYIYIYIMHNMRWQRIYIYIYLMHNMRWQHIYIYICIMHFMRQQRQVQRHTLIIQQTHSHSAWNHVWATNYRALLRKINYKNKASYNFTPPCNMRDGMGWLCPVGSIKL